MGTAATKQFLSSFMTIYFYIVCSSCVFNKVVISDRNALAYHILEQNFDH